MDNSETEDKMMTVAEVAEFLGFRPATIYGYIRNGKIPVYRASGRWRFRYSEIQEWLQENTRKSNDQAAYQIGEAPFRSDLEGCASKDMKLQRKDFVSGDMESRRKGCALLRDTGIIDGLDKKEIELLSGVIRCREEKYRAQDTVILNVQKMDGFLIVESGILNIFMGTGEESAASEHEYGRKNVLGLDVMMSEERVSYFTAVAKEDTDIMVYAFDSFLGKQSLPDTLRAKVFTNISKLLAEANIQRIKSWEF